MWTKVKFEKSDKSNDKETFGVVTAVWEESTPNEVVYQEFINVDTDIANFVQNANGTKDKILATKIEITQKIEDERNFSDNILVALNQ